MSWEIPQIPSAGIFPSIDQIELFSEHLKKSIDKVQIENDKRQDTEDDDFLSEILDSNNDEVADVKVETRLTPSPLSSSSPAGKISASSELSSNISPSTMPLPISIQKGNIKYDNIRYKLITHALIININTNNAGYQKF